MDSLLDYLPLLTLILSLFGILGSGLAWAFGWRHRDADLDRARMHNTKLGAEINGIVSTRWREYAEKQEELRDKCQEELKETIAELELCNSRIDTLETIIKELKNGRVSGADN